MTVQPGSRLGPYQIVERLGSGGMGDVWKARDTRLNRFAAVKTLRPGQFSDSRRERFIHEAQTASSLNHPNIVTIYDIDRQDGVDYMGMEFIPGKTLDAVI